MTFSDEFATDEDIEKYDLNGIWDKYHPARKGKYYIGQRPSFTIDRERNIFYMGLSRGQEEQSNRSKVLLWVRGYHVVFEIDFVSGLNPNGLKSTPYRKRWELAGIHPQKGIKENHEELKSILKEALTVYGHMGVHKQISNTVVEFNF